MSPDWLIIADDLTGAADCAIAFARRGVDTVVTWSDGDVQARPIVTVDANSRRLTAAAAAARQCAVLAGRWREGRLLYKKIDSTLRGQPAAETAALLAALGDKGRPSLAFVAPAFPATGRTTEGGRVLMNGERLEDTPLWARDHTYENASLPDILAGVGLRSRSISRDALRQGPESARRLIATALADGYDAVVCDAASEDDLVAAAEASLPLAERLLFVGTGGLATALARVAVPEGKPLPLAAPSSSHVLVLVGSVAEASRAAAGRLAASGHVRAFTIPEPLLLDRGECTTTAQTLADEIAEALAKDDVLVQTEFGPLSSLGRAVEVAARLADVVAPAAARAGGLVATGGDTVCALLGRLNATGIRLYDEVEPGIPIGMTVGSVALPVATKAGGFGTDASLARCLERLHQVLGQSRT